MQSKSGPMSTKMLRSPSEGMLPANVTRMRGGGTGLGCVGGMRPKHTADAIGDGDGFGGDVAIL